MKIDKAMMAPPTQPVETPNEKKSVPIDENQSLSKDRHGRKVIHRKGPRHSLSRSQIQQKLMEITGDVEFLRPGPKGQKAELKPVVSVHDPKGDVGLNNPNDPNTIEKLRSIIKSDGFNFNQKEKDVISKIIG